MFDHHDYALISNTYEPTVHYANSNFASLKDSSKKFLKKPIVVWLGGQAVIFGLTISAIAVKSHLPTSE